LPADRIGSGYTQVITYEIEDSSHRSWISELATSALKMDQSERNLFYATFGSLLGAVVLVAAF
jgi:hypothetical protein